MVKDYVPVRSSVTTGVVIKQHILERNKYPVPQVSPTSSIAMVGSNATSSVILFQGNDDVSGGLCYPITASGVYNLYVTGSVENSTGDDPTLFDIYITSSNGISSLFSQNISLGATVAFSGSYNAPIPSGSSLCFVPDSPGDFFTNSVTASLLLVNTLTTPYQTEDMLITGSPIQMYTIDGGTGGTMPDLFGLTASNFTYNNVVNITQSWTGSTPSLLGPVAFVDDSQIEFYNGALSGSSIIVETGSLNHCEVEIIPIYTTTSISGGAFLSPNVTYSPGNSLQRDVDVDKTYYIQFTSYNDVSSLASASVRIYDNSGRTFYSGTNSTNPGQPAPGQSYTSYQIQISNPVYPLYFASATGVNIATATDITLFEQYIDPECLVVQNDVPLNRPNPKFFDVDFAQSSIVAQNAAVIISASRGSGSATPSTVPESNYTTARSANPRYNGCENTSPDFNIGSGNSNPAVEIDQTYFAYFDWVGGTTPEIIPKTGIHLKYLIGEDGTVLTPNITGSYYYNLIRTFNEKQKANVLFQTAETSGNVAPLQGVKTVLKSGALSQAIIFSQTGSNSGFLTTMSFGSNIGSYNYSLNATIPAAGLPANNTYYVLDLVNPITSGSTATTASLTDDYVLIQTSDPSSQIIPKLYLQFDYYEFNGNPGYIDLFIETSTDNVSWTNYYSQNYNLVSGQSYSITVIPTNTTTPIQNTYFRSRLIYGAYASSGGSPSLTINAGNFYISQNPPFQTLVTSSYWFTGSSSQNVLTGSQFNVDMYGISTQSPVSGSGYDSPYQTFDLQRGDQIRFSADENQLYQILEINQPSQNIDNTLYLTLDKSIVSGTNLNSFLIKRYVPNPNYVIIDANKTSTVGGGPGFLIPEYASQTLLDKFDSIIADLTAKGII
jgi:hypothetical protein